MTDRQAPVDAARDDSGLGDVPPGREPPAGAGLLQNAVGVLRSPAATYRTIAVHEPLGQAMAIVLVAFALMAVMQAAEVATDPHAPLQLLPWAVVSGLSGVVAFVVWTGVVLLCAKVLGGSGGFRGTFIGLGFAYVPLILGGVLAVASLALGAAGQAIWVLALFVATIWSFVLDVLAVREVHELTTGRAVGAVLLPIVVFGVLIVLLFITLLAAMATAT